MRDSSALHQITRLLVRDYGTNSAESTNPQNYRHDTFHKLRLKRPQSIATVDGVYVSNRVVPNLAQLLMSLITVAEALIPHISPPPHLMGAKGQYHQKSSSRRTPHCWNRPRTNTVAVRPGIRADLA